MTITNDARRVDRKIMARGRARLRRHPLKIQKIETIWSAIHGKPGLCPPEHRRGNYGVGEGTPGQLNRAVEGAPMTWSLVLGMSPDIEALVLRLNRDIYGDGGQIKMAAISALEIAC
jgi:L-alanine-DL-glutamate epimerase-like enolase superfamily enzyme